MAFTSSVNPNLLVNEEPVYKIADSWDNIGAKFQYGPDSAVVVTKAFPRQRGGGVSTDSLGINNGIIDPYLVANAITIKKVSVLVNKACVSQGTVGASPTVRVDIYRTLASSRTLLGTARVVLSPAGVGVSSTTASCFQYATLTLGVPIAVVAGALLGVEFVTESSDNNKINGVENMMILLQA
jgi:hypothetical protein